LRHLQALTILATTMLATPATMPTEAPWCGPTRITGYVRTDGNPFTFDGTSIYTAEHIVAASWDVALGTLATIEGLPHVYRVADRGKLGNGNPTPWVDVAVWSRAEAYALTSTRHVCFRRQST
jgi:hypothetical protein